MNFFAIAVSVVLCFCLLTSSNCMNSAQTTSVNDELSIESAGGTCVTFEQLPEEVVEMIGLPCPISRRFFGYPHVRASFSNPSTFFEILIKHDPQFMHKLSAYFQGQFDGVMKEDGIDVDMVDRGLQLMESTMRQRYSNLVRAVKTMRCYGPRVQSDCRFKDEYTSVPVLRLILGVVFKLGSVKQVDPRMEAMLQCFHRDAFAIFKSLAEQFHADPTKNLSFLYHHQSRATGDAYY